MIGVELSPSRFHPPQCGALEIAIELARLDPVVNHSAADAEALRDVGLGETFIQEVFEQHEGVPSEHDARLRRRDVECEEGQCIPRPHRVEHCRTDVPQVCNFGRCF